MTSPNVLCNPQDTSSLSRGPFSFGPKKARPESITARVALALAYLGYASDARGTGYANTVSESGWKWKNRWEELRNLGNEVAYGLTGVIYASYPPAWTEIAAGLQPDELPERKPYLLAGYQSPDEAKAELGWQPLEDTKGLKPQTSTTPGGRPVDHVVALHIRRTVYEPSIPNPEESFLAAVQLAENDRFLRARRKLFDWEDDLFVDGWEPQEAEKKLSGLEEEYRDAVNAEVAQMCIRGVATLLPKAAGWGITALGHPELKEPASKTLEYVTGKFVDMAKPQDPDALPGAALHMIRAAYRNHHATPVESNR